MLLTNTLHSAVRLVDNVPCAHQIELSQPHACTCSMLETILVHEPKLYAARTLNTKLV